MPRQANLQTFQRHEERPFRCRTLAGRSGWLIAALTLFVFNPSVANYAYATEAVAGRYIPGVFAIPLGGVVPPAGVYWNADTTFYHGSLSADVAVPVAGELRAGLKATIIGETFTGLWVPNVEIAPDASLAFSLSVPVEYLDASAFLGRREVSQAQTALGDIALGSKIGWHSGAHFFSLGLNVFAPTGKWEEGALDNIGMNYWTFSPTLAYTHLDTERSLDFSVTAGIDLNTENTDTDYHSGAMAHVDALILKGFTKRFSAGLFGSILYQVEDDSGGLADRLDGFKGRSFAIGPILKYTAGPEDNPISFSLNWAPEFGVKNRPKGNAVYFSIAGKF